MARSIRAGIFNDLGSGSNVDLCVITKEGVKYLRRGHTLVVFWYTLVVYWYTLLITNPSLSRFSSSWASTLLQRILHAPLFACNNAHIAGGRRWSSAAFSSV